MTVNGDQVFIVTSRNLSVSIPLFDLDEQRRDFLSEARSNFTQNLAGLKFARYTSGSSMRLSQSQARGLTDSSFASRAISQMEQVHRGAAPAAAGTLHDGQVDSGATTPRLLTGHRAAEPVQGSQWESELKRQTTPPATSPSTSTTSLDESAAISACSSNRIGESFNYYNLLQAPLNETLTGDIYYFDLHCNILDVYSSTVSIRQRRGLSALYRDQNFFSYASSGLPLAINR